ncbi:MAG TPA: EAL domain-containing protein, partial [Micromonosporaceae bacterium]|nr:EAL domain-containing protein [Micromonosporaceae bacterium]
AVVARHPTREVPGAGRCYAVAAPLGGEVAGHLVVARSGEDGFSIDELSLLRSMARVLELTLATLRTIDAERRQADEKNRLLASLRERQRLLETLSVIQRAITRRAPLQDILDAITAGARDLLRDDAAGLYVLDPDDPEVLLLFSSTGLPPGLNRALWRLPVAGTGVVSQAARRDGLVVFDDYQHSPDAVPAAAAASIQAAMAAPVHEHSTVVGSLAIASFTAGRAYTDADREVLAVFAEHVSLALTDARTREELDLAFHDSLTGLANRALFLDRLEHALTRTSQDGSKLAVLFVDLDRFKNVNDSLGHTAGDELLIGVAERLRACLGPDDTAARLGGDEFAVLCEDCDRAEVTGTAQHIIDRLRAPFLLGGHETFIDASVGISFSGGPQSAAELIRDADLAMYQAKKRGKGRYEIFHPELRTTFLRNLDIEARLRQAIGRGDLVLHYQPMVRLADGGIAGVEALVRWRSGHEEVIAPEDFIPLAEETGLIVAIDEWVLWQACRQGGRWNRRAARGPGHPLSVSVNLSTRQLQQPGLPDLISRALDATGLAPESLILELTESRLMQDEETTSARLRELKALGVRVAIDDFGTGYSSLAYLRQFPADIVKIDKSFVAGAVPRSDGAALARAIVHLGHTLRLTTVAEGVETAAQLDELRAAGCDLAQGFYLGSPMEPDEITRLLSGRLDAPPVPPSISGVSG